MQTRYAAHLTSFIFVDERRFQKLGASMYLALSVKMTLRLRSKYTGYHSNKYTVQDGHLRKAGERCDGVSFPTGLCPGHGRCCTAGITAAYPVRAAPLSLMSNLTPYVQPISSYSTDTLPKLFLQEVKRSYVQGNCHVRKVS